MAATTPTTSFFARQSTQARVARVGAYAAVTLLAMLYAAPFLWMVATSLKDPSELDAVPPIWIPKVLQWQNYPNALLRPTRYFPLFFENTAIYVGLSVLGQLISCSLVAYGFARIPFKGSKFLFTLVLSTMMLPPQVLLIPQYLLFKQLGWLDSLLPLVVPQWFGSAFYIFLLRQFFMTIPRELDEAALVDGAHRLDIFWRILLPLCRPILITVFALSFVTHWNDFFGPLIYLNSQKNMVVATALRLFAMSQQALPIHELMAASVTSVIPVIVVFLFCQRAFVRGITMTGMKEG
ncbi:MAG TPA: carbohydrate ABC transporter permease [Chloroflexota bacterium]|jgi:multiple sugar transport system permease protein|nr:carbohydrate ABC transporter permease [Chloroflexota bacterium]